MGMSTLLMYTIEDTQSGMKTLVTLLPQFHALWFLNSTEDQNSTTLIFSLGDNPVVIGYEKGILFQNTKFLVTTT